jgi:hypothetical protein
MYNTVSITLYVVLAVLLISISINYVVVLKYNKLKKELECKIKQADHINRCFKEAQEIIRDSLSNRPITTNENYKILNPREAAVSLRSIIKRLENDDENT